MATFSVKLPTQKPGENKVELDITLAGTPLLKTTLTLTVPDFYRADYGELIQSVTGPAAVWWCDATHKVPRARPLPSGKGTAARILAQHGRDIADVSAVLISHDHSDHVRCAGVFQRKYVVQFHRTIKAAAYGLPAVSQSNSSEPT